MAIQLYTIGFTKKNAEQFFNILRESNVKRIIDVRLKNVSQLAGFAKRDDLRFFLKELCHADYIHLPQCAPTKEILDTYKKDGEDWKKYENNFIPLIKTRKIENILTTDLLDHGCLLCSESTPEQCHRRLVAEYMHELFPEITITHL